MIMLSGCYNNDDDSSSPAPVATYKVSFSVDGAAKVYTGGLTERYSGALSSYDNTPETSIYAFPAAISFTNLVNSTYTDGIMITDFAGNSAGTYASCNISYKENGTIYAASNVSVTITAYGATGAAVTGTVADCQAGTKALTAITFNVYNSGAE